MVLVVHLLSFFFFVIVVLFLPFVNPIALTTRPVRVWKVIHGVGATRFNVLGNVLRLLILGLNRLSTLNTCLIVIHVTVVEFFMLKEITRLVLSSRADVCGRGSNVMGHYATSTRILLINRR